jgi:hypothetical protein
LVLVEGGREVPLGADRPVLVVEGRAPVRRRRIDRTDLDDGWAVNTYDSLFVVSQAIRTLHTTDKPTRGQVNSAIGSFTPGYGRRGAGGLISFDNANNREGVPALVRLCPGSPATTPFTVRVEGRDPDDGTVGHRH